MGIGNINIRTGTKFNWERTGTKFDAAGSRLPTIELVKKDIPCQMQPASSDVREAYAKRELNVTHSVFLEQVLDIHEGDRITVSGNVGRESWTKTLLVIGYSDLAGQTRIMRLDVRIAS